MHIHLSLFATSRGIAPCLEDWLRIHCLATAPACPAEPKCNCSISGRAEIGATAGTDGPSLDWHNHKKSQHVAATQVLVLMNGIGNPSEIYGQNSIYLTVNWWIDGYIQYILRNITINGNRESGSKAKFLDGFMAQMAACHLCIALFLFFHPNCQCWEAGSNSGTFIDIEMNWEHIPLEIFENLVFAGFPNLI